MKTQTIKLSEIVSTAGTQIRAAIDPDTVDQYAESMQDVANRFPPVAVFHDGSQFILADGFHRVMAASRNGFLDIEAEVHKGTKSDALKFALGANATHGLKRSNADKRRSVELAITEWPKMSDREISKICAVSVNCVSALRTQLSSDDSSLNPPTRIGADGKERRLPKRKAKPQADPQPESPSPAPSVDESDIPFDAPTGPQYDVAEVRSILDGVEAAAEDLREIINNPTEERALQDIANLLKLCAQNTLKLKMV